MQAVAESSRFDHDHDQSLSSNSPSSASVGCRELSSLALDMRPKFSISARFSDLHSIVHKE